jgi:alginate O-acetyltransferase complex protein AlgI
VSTLAAAYVPTSIGILVALSAILVGVIVAGYTLQRLGLPRAARIAVWTTFIVGILGVERLCAGQPPGFRMLALICFALLVMKVIVLLEEQAQGMAPLTFIRWLGFSACWIGMQPRFFASRAAGPLGGAGGLIRHGLGLAIAGAVLVVLARLAWTELQSRLLASLLLLPGLSLMLHFGVCNILAGAWRLRGVPCDALFRAPLRSQNLGEFWAKRWNLAFSEMTAIAVYRPLAAHVGRGPALLAGFAVSGFLHELAISVPVGAGFGRPLLYFLMHGALVLVERRLSRAGHPLNGWIGRVWVFVWVLVPLPLLFHEPFLAGVIWPLIGMPAR